MRELKTKNVMPQLAVRENAPADPTAHPAIVSGAVATFGAPAPTASAGRERDTRLRGMVDRYVDFVARVLRNAGTPDAEIDDEVQRTFITAARRLDDVLEIPRGTVASRLRRARSEFRERVAALEGVVQGKNG